MSKEFLKNLDVQVHSVTELKKIPLPRDLGRGGKVNFFWSFITFGLLALEWPLGIASAALQAIWVLRFNRSGPGRARKNFVSASHAIREKKYEKAAHYYEVALRDSPKTRAIYPILGDIYLKMDQTKQGVELYKTYLETQPQDRLIQIKLLFILIRGEMYREALALLESMPEELTGDYLISVIKTFAQLRIKQPELAKKTLRSISADELDGEGKDVPINYLWGRVFLAEGKKAEAERYFKRVLEQKDDFLDTAELLKKCH